MYTHMSLSKSCINNNNSSNTNSGINSIHSSNHSINNKYYNINCI